MQHVIDALVLGYTEVLNADPRDNPDEMAWIHALAACVDPGCEQQDLRYSELIVHKAIGYIARGEVTVPPLAEQHERWAKRPITLLTSVLENDDDLYRDEIQQGLAHFELEMDVVGDDGEEHEVKVLLESGAAV
jgi:hypothetical protein